MEGGVDGEFVGEDEGVEVAAFGVVEVVRELVDFFLGFFVLVRFFFSG